MDSAVKLIEAIAKLLGAIAWPAAVITIAIVLLRRHRAAVDSILGRVETVTLPGGVEFVLTQRIEEQEQHVIEAADRVAEAEPDERPSRVERLVEETNRHRELQRLTSIMNDTSQPRAMRQKALEDLADKHDLKLWVADTQIKTIEDLEWVRTVGPTPDAFRRRVKRLVE